MNPTETVRRGYDLVSDIYCPDDGGANRIHYSAWLAALEKRLVKGSEVLDLGCGCGVPVCLELSKRHSVTGVDISEVQVARAHRLVPAGTFSVGDIAEVTYGAETWDCIVALYSVIHLPVGIHQDLLTRMSDWLRPGGLILISGGSEEWTGMEESWLGVPGATMFWSHADTATYRFWLRKCGFGLLAEWFQPEGAGGHPISWHRRDEPRDRAGGPDGRRTKRWH